jgi:soluble lytic murein transglycosylase
VTQQILTVGTSRSTARRQAAARRAAARARRRRLALVLGGLGLLIVAIVVTMPLLRKAVNDLGLPLAYQDVIRQQAAEKHLDPALIAAVIYAETKFQPRVSPAGAEGLMQIEPQTAQFLAHRSGATTFTLSDLGTPAVNIAYGTYYLRYLINSYHGNVTLGLAAYNGGITNVDDWLAAARRHGGSLTVNEIPFPETRAYVKKVLHAQREYRSSYASQLGYRS